MPAVRRPGQWPRELWVVRHGESAGNVARDRAEAEHRAVIDIGIRDMDVPLSDRGREQAKALGRRLRTEVPEGFDAVLCSPYVRAQDTARIALDEAGFGSIETLTDERLREREFGILDRLTRAGIQERYPEQAEARTFFGKFYHRPPGGESWCDVALRLRSVLDTLSLDNAGERVLLASHQVVILMLRYLLERLTEAEVLEIDRRVEVLNCSITRYRLSEAGQLVLEDFNDVRHVEESPVAVTEEPDATTAPLA